MKLHGPSLFALARKKFHMRLLSSALTIDREGIPSIADKGQKFSREVSTLLVKRLGQSSPAEKQAGQISGHDFEFECKEFIDSCFSKLSHLRPGNST